MRDEDVRERVARVEELLGAIEGNAEAVAAVQALEPPGDLGLIHGSRRTSASESS